jgi:hypothetical protein
MTLVILKKYVENLKSFKNKEKRSVILLQPI